MIKEIIYEGNEIKREKLIENKKGKFDQRRKCRLKENI